MSGPVSIRVIDLARRTVEYDDTRQGPTPECYSYATVDLSRALLAVLEHGDRLRELLAQLPPAPKPLKERDEK